MKWSSARLFRKPYFAEWILNFSTFLHFTDSWSVKNWPNCCMPHSGIFRTLHKLIGITLFFPQQTFLWAGIHTSHLHTGARKCIPAARVAIWWQAVGGRKDELCQWQPLKRTTHSSVAGEAWWMIISRCDRCCIGGGALTFHPFLPPLSLSLSFSRLAYLGQCFNTPLALLYWHTPDSVWWLMSTWEPLSLFPFYFFSLLLIGPLQFSP